MITCTDRKTEQEIVSTNSVPPLCAGFVLIRVVVPKAVFYSEFKNLVIMMSMIHFNARSTK